ncbi:hypothetical protein HanRHA438_Chr05g0218901 [Helianthus annuus]|uniref:Uncharacterized protein n=1 Tax=Helianthus annuus TaxID=4232 RepID=A0A251UN19_HELAN|nr:hypothetical protein HanXRQr2_Chr05g0209401 [Helianthus annuus]KAJ0569867.1 hypothetical protein HanHA300_Chr05g0171521 [Helianthus annuus]KAJ0584197.1 hypothetical protein HanHA89_Chr05g0185781 [Helianthus annuus]KAJ0749866.1 hypothetical protein HanLR1_Chr05g0175181 [Helianthus annuus]KAJ0918521.1 hypothetical protein HanRHA438_Chr05g0218901 [Helianthus annuus]
MKRIWAMWHVMVEPFADMACYGGGFSLPQIRRFTGFIITLGFQLLHNAFNLNLYRLLHHAPNRLLYPNNHQFPSQILGFPRILSPSSQATSFKEPCILSIAIEAKKM